MSDILQHRYTRIDATDHITFVHTAHRVMRYKTLFTQRQLAKTSGTIPSDAGTNWSVYMHTGWCTK